MKSMRSLGVVVCLITTWGITPVWSALEPYRNEELIEASAGPDRGAEAQAYQYHEKLLPHNAGTKLFENENLSIHLQANRVPAKQRGQTLSGNNRLFFENGVCDEIPAPGLRNGNKTLLASTLAVVLKKKPIYELTRRWLWEELRPLLRSEIADRYCGGNIQYIFTQVFVQGYEIGNQGKVDFVVDRTYDTFDLGSELERRRLGKFRILPLASTDYYFWDKFSSDLQEAYRTEGLANDQGLHFPEMGVHASQGSYYEVFHPRMAFGGRGTFYREKISLDSYARSFGKTVPDQPTTPQPEPLPLATIVSSERSASGEQQPCEDKYEQINGVSAYITSRAGKDGRAKIGYFDLEVFLRNNAYTSLKGNMNPNMMRIDLYHWRLLTSDYEYYPTLTIDLDYPHFEPVTLADGKPLTVKVVSNNVASTSFIMERTLHEFDKAWTWVQNTTGPHIQRAQTEECWVPIF